MNKKDWPEIERLLNEAYDLQPSERQKFIDEIRSEGLRREVKSLLEFESESEKFLDTPAINVAADFFCEGVKSDGLAGKIIGNYRITGELDRGGMGAVYLAERADGKFEQKVALKLLRREHATSDIRRRFRLERQILAALQHPNIARLLDAGTTDDGVPFLAMEYVEGSPIDEFCGERNLDLGEKLKIFQKVCETVAFAHRKLIVHRDLKPSNILVTKDGVPKLLDFGISKLLAPEHEPEDTQTITRLGAMTPEYASPEQLKGESVTTATDIYSLGVILYELLTARRPFEGSVAEIIKAVPETDPVPPSSAATNFASARKKHPDETRAESGIRSLNPKSLRGDVDNIVLKALKKEPERRYPSVEQFAEDIRRYLRGLPVSARPDTFSYRTSKFVQRHKYGVSAAALLSLAILGGVVATLWQARVAQAERDRARLQAAKAARINDFLQNILNFSNPAWTSSNPERNRRATVAEAVDEAARRLETELAEEPEIQAEVQLTLGKSYLGSGRYDEAERLFRSSSEKFGRTLEEKDPKTLQAVLGLADTLLLKGKYREAEPLYRKIIPEFRRAVAEDESQTKWLAAALNDLGLLLNYQGETSEAELLFRESLEHASKLSGQDRSIITISMGNLGMAHRNRGELRKALDFYNQARAELRRTSDEASFEEGTLLNNIGIILKLLGEYPAAEKKLHESYDRYLKAVGEEHQYAVYPVIQLADVYYLRGDYARGRETVDRALAVQRKLFPEGHLDITYSKNVLGNILTATGEAEKGEALLREALRMRRKALKEPHYLIAEVKLSLGENMLAQKRFDEARSLLTEARNDLMATVGETHPTTTRCRESLAKIEGFR